MRKYDEEDKPQGIAVHGQIAAGELELVGTTLVLAGAGNAGQAGSGAQTRYRFETLDNSHDVTFNQLLGINN